MQRDRILGEEAIDRSNDRSLVVFGRKVPPNSRETEFNKHSRDVAVFEFDRALAAIDMVSQGTIMRRLVEGNAGDFFAEHIKIVGYDAVELVISPVLSGARHARKMNQSIVDV